MTRVRLAGGAGVACRHWENSEVSLPGLVAVAVMNWPGVTEAGSVTLKVALPSAPVVAMVKPRKVWPSPKPEGSQVGLPKNSMRKVVLAVLLSVPWIVALVPPAAAEVSIGKFCQLFGPGW